MCDQFGDESLDPLTQTSEISPICAHIQPTQSKTQAKEINDSISRCSPMPSNLCMISLIDGSLNPLKQTSKISPKYTQI